MIQDWALLPILFRSGEMQPFEQLALARIVALDGSEQPPLAKPSMSEVHLYYIYSIVIL